MCLSLRVFSYSGLALFLLTNYSSDCLQQSLPALSQNLTENVQENNVDIFLFKIVNPGMD